MTSIKTVLKTTDIIESIKLHVHAALRYYENTDDDSWKAYVDMALYQFRTLTLVGLKKNSDFSVAYDELVILTGFNELYKYSIISGYINERI